MQTYRNVTENTTFQVSVNEAAAQICRLVPAMLTRRDELFPLARQVVRDSGYQYSKGHSRYNSTIDCIIKSPTYSTFRSTFSISNKLFNGDDGPFKRMRFSEDNEKIQLRRVSRYLYGFLSWSDSLVTADTALASYLHTQQRTQCHKYSTHDVY